MRCPHSPQRHYGKGRSEGRAGGRVSPGSRPEVFSRVHLPHLSAVAETTDQNTKLALSVFHLRASGRQVPRSRRVMGKPPESPTRGAKSRGYEAPAAKVPLAFVERLATDAKGSTGPRPVESGRDS